jgi:hypothetical protein
VAKHGNNGGWETNDHEGRQSTGHQVEIVYVDALYDLILMHHMVLPCSVPFNLVAARSAWNQSAGVIITHHMCTESSGVLHI